MVIGYRLTRASKYYLIIESNEGTYVEWGINGTPWGSKWTIESADSLAERKCLKGYRIAQTINIEPVIKVTTLIVHRNGYHRHHQTINGLIIHDFGYRRREPKKTYKLITYKGTEAFELPGEFDDLGMVQYTAALYSKSSNQKFAVVYLEDGKTVYAELYEDGELISG